MLATTVMLIMPMHGEEFNDGSGKKAVEDVLLLHVLPLCISCIICVWCVSYVLCTRLLLHVCYTFFYIHDEHLSSLLLLTNHTLVSSSSHCWPTKYTNSPLCPQTVGQPHLHFPLFTICWPTTFLSPLSITGHCKRQPSFTRSNTSMYTHTHTFV